MKSAANYLVGDTVKLLSDVNRGITDIKITAENFAELICITVDGTINSSAAQIVLAEMFENGGDPSHIIEDKGLAQENDEGALMDVVQTVMGNNEKAVEDYRNGNENAMKALMGQVMKETGGSANPQKVMEILKKELN